MQGRLLTLFVSGIVTAAGVLTAVGATPAAAAAQPAGAAAHNIPTPPAPRPPDEWHLGSIPSPTTTFDVQLAAAACASASFCVAVGNASNGSGDSTTLIEQWDGTTWTIVDSPNAQSAGQNQLYGVSCVGPTSCMAVGVSGPGSTFVDPLAEQWNGQSWMLVTPLNPPASPATQLNAVSCASATSCMAVGYSKDGSNNRIALAEQWNGTSWALSPTMSPSGSLASQLNAVDCVTTQWCMAAGDYEAANTDFLSLAMTWAGNTWTSVASPNPGAGTSGEFNSVACAGPGFCVAVGQWYNGTVFQDQMATWNGSSWTNVTVPEGDPSMQNFLDAVACVSATSCTAVGSEGEPAASPVTLSWDGQRWAGDIVRAPDGSTSAGLNAVTCLANWQCIALGSSDPAPVSQPYVATADVARLGYRLVASDGGVFAYSVFAPFLGSMGGQHLNGPIVGMAVMPAGDGYYLVASDGGIFNYGSAQFYGSTGSMHLNAPVVGMAVTADGAGYWLVASDGGIFAFGDASFYGSTGSLHLNKPVVGMAATPDGRGYYLVASDGGIFNYGDAAFDGSMGGSPLNQPVVGMASPMSGGYYLVASDGGIFTFPTNGGPPFEGSTGSLRLNKPIVGMAAVEAGYYLAGSDGGVFAFPGQNGPDFLGSTGSTQLNAPIVGIAG
jgi:hypothetical protein